MTRRRSMRQSASRLSELLTHSLTLPGGNFNRQSTGSQFGHQEARENGRVSLSVYNVYAKYRLVGNSPGSQIMGKVVAVATSGAPSSALSKYRGSCVCERERRAASAGDQTTLRDGKQITVSGNNEARN